MIRSWIEFVVLVQLAGLEIALIARVGPELVPDLSVLVIVASLVARDERRILPRFASLSIARATFAPGSFVYWLWWMLAAYWCVRPFSRRFFPDRWPFQAVSAFALAALASLCGSVVLASGDGDPYERGITAWIVTGVVVPGCLVVGSLFGLGKRAVMRPEVSS
ncbi:MAG: hypothetical protein KDC95_19525 [Planctomycetes bacterium]|nr:hypothetical protein [Planctomycetota bacterium]